MTWLALYTGVVEHRALSLAEKLTFQFRSVAEQRTCDLLTSDDRSVFEMLLRIQELALLAIDHSLLLDYVYETTYFFTYPMLF